MELEIFSDQLKNLGKRIESIKETIQTEEATKTALIMPFFQILGWDVFNPLEFTPEFTADVGIKKGEKVDYAIITNNQPAILIEAKSVNEKLNKHDSQLFRYFATTTSKFGILTNGQEYKFYTDLDEPNKMDATPFLAVDVTKIKDTQIKELAKFHKDNFDIEAVANTAVELKYLNNLKAYLTEQFTTPSEDFTKFILGEIYDGVKTKNTLEKFEPIIKKGLSQFITEKVNERLNKALNNTNENTVTISEENIKNELTEEHEKHVEDIITTAEEIEAYTTIKVLVCDEIPAERIYYRDNRSYFNILLDDSIRKWIVRIYINSNGIKLVFNNNDKTVIELDKILDIVNHKTLLVETMRQFM